MAELISESLEWVSVSTYRFDYMTAKIRKTCVVCKSFAGNFRDKEAEFGYLISAIYYKCQYKYFQGGE